MTHSPPSDRSEIRVEELVMRTFTTACLALGLLLHVGCASTPRMTAQRMPKPRSSAAARYLAAKQMERQDKLEPARQIYEELLAQQPGNPEYMHRLAVVCTRLQRDGEAIHWYAKARRRDPKNAALLTDMGYSCYLRGDADQAEQLLRQARHLKPSDKRAAMTLAMIVGYQGKIDECLSLFREIGNEANALAGLASVHRDRGEYDLAEQRYQAALVIDPNLKNATQALAELSKRQPWRNANVAETRSTATESFGDSEASPITVESPVIQQVSAVWETSKHLLTTANFTEESSVNCEPARLPEDDDITGRASISATIAVSPLNQDDSSDEDLLKDDAPALLDSAPCKNVPLAIDDWDVDQSPTKGTSVKSNCSESIAMEWAPDEEPLIMKPSTDPDVVAHKALKFGPRKPRSEQPTMPTLLDENQEFVPPSRSDEFADTE